MEKKEAEKGILGNRREIQNLIHDIWIGFERKPSLGRRAFVWRRHVREKELISLALQTTLPHCLIGRYIPGVKEEVASLARVEDRSVGPTQMSFAHIEERSLGGGQWRIHWAGYVRLKPNSR